MKPLSFRALCLNLFLALSMMFGIVAILQHHHPRTILDNPVFAQTPTCAQTGTITSATVGTSLNNRTTNSTACALWRLEYWYTGFSAVTVQLEGAPDNGSGAPGSFAAMGSTFTLYGANPCSASGSCNIVVQAYFPWVRLNVTTATGSGSIRYKLVGFDSANAQNRLGTPGAPGATGATGPVGPAPAGTGVVNVTAGVAGLVSGSASDCVLVDGTSGSCGSGGGTGVLVSGSTDPGVPSATVVQSTSGLVSSIAYASGVTAGNLLVVCIAVDGSTSNAVVSDTLLNTWVQQGSVASNTKKAQVWATISGSSGANTVAATVAGGSFQVMAITEISGDVTSTADAQASGSTPPAITTVTPYDILITCGAHNGGFAFSASGATTLLTSTNNGGGSMGLGYQVVTSASTVTSGINSGANIYASRAIRPASVASPGNNGDWYLNLVTGILWGPKTSGTWGHSGWKFTAE